MNTSVLGTSSSCRTTGRVTRSACLVGGVFPPSEVIDHITIRILPWRLHGSSVGRISVQGMSSDPSGRRSRIVTITYRSGSFPGTTRSRSPLRIDSTNGRTRLDVNLQQAISKPSAPQSQSISLEYGTKPSIPNTGTGQHTNESTGILWLALGYSMAATYHLPRATRR